MYARVIPRYHLQVGYNNMLILISCLDDFIRASPASQSLESSRALYERFQLAVRYLKNQFTSLKALLQGGQHGMRVLDCFPFCIFLTHSHRHFRTQACLQIDEVLLPFAPSR